jgi:hypothetical protein
VISTGTTTCCWYGTIHSTTKLLAAVCHRRGQRAFVGKCNMDRNSADYYQEESAQKSLEDTEDYVSWVRKHCDSSATTATQTVAPSKTPRKSTALVQPILTPRFAISCSDELMSGLGDMMDRDPELPLQTHLAENPAEVEFALCELRLFRRPLSQDSSSQLEQPSILASNPTPPPTTASASSDPTRSSRTASFSRAQSWISSKLASLESLTAPTATSTCGPELLASRTCSTRGSRSRWAPTTVAVLPSESSARCEFIL